MVHHARRILFAAWLATALPWFWLATRDLLYELASVGETSDAPHRFGLLASVQVLVPFTGVSLLVALLLGVHVWLKEPAMRRRVVLWFGLLVGGAAFSSLGPGPGSLPSRAAFNALQAAWLGCLCALPAFWSVRSRAR